MSTKASEDVIHRLEVTINTLRDITTPLSEKQENSLLRNITTFPKGIDHTKRVARIYLRAESLNCGDECLAKIIRSDLKLANCTADILLLTDEAFKKFISKWCLHWSNLSRDKMKETVQNYIDETCTMYDFQFKGKFDDHDFLKLSAKLFLIEEKKNIFTKAEVLIKEGLKPDYIGIDRHGHVSIVEAKVTLKDYENKLNKITAYTKYCNYFYLLTADENVVKVATNFFVEHNMTHACAILYRNSRFQSFSSVQTCQNKIDVTLLQQIPQLLANVIANRIKLIDWNPNKTYCFNEILETIQSVLTKYQVD